MLNRTLHETHLRKILSNLFENKTLTSQLAFKGGTCLYLFYGLDRFSTDLDFNALTEDLNVDEITKVISDYGIEDSNFTDKRLTWFWLLNYAKKTMNIKLEVSKRDYPDTYEIKETLGVRVKCMTTDCMFAHKLCAVTDRAKLVNRDLYDSLFMFNRDFPINEEIIKLRMGKTTLEYLTYLADFIEQNVDPRTILNGLGEVLNEAQKDRAKVKLKPDLIFAIRNYIASNTPRVNLTFSD
jgi:predicted nucleotidyltransferase component of viral defense system